jgi:hypothetical protein
MCIEANLTALGLPAPAHFIIGDHGMKVIPCPNGDRFSACGRYMRSWYVGSTWRGLSMLLYRSSTMSESRKSSDKSQELYELIPLLLTDLFNTSATAAPEGGGQKTCPPLE